MSPKPCEEVWGWSNREDGDYQHGGATREDAIDVAKANSEDYQAIYVLRGAWIDPGWGKGTFDALMEAAEENVASQSRAFGFDNAFVAMPGAAEALVALLTKWSEEYLVPQWWLGDGTEECVRDGEEGGGE